VVRKKARTKPIILVVDNEQHHLARLDDELSDRYGRHYEVICIGSAEEGMSTLQGLVGAGREIALILADQWMDTTTGAEFLAATKSLDAGSKRGLLVSWGAWGTIQRRKQSSAR
jgi:DNA-binding NtrC family response regulator